MKKLIATILVIAVCFSVPAMAYYDNNYVLSFSGDMNSAVVESIPLGATDIPLTRSNSQFTMILNNDSEDVYSATGQILLESGPAEYTVSGHLQNIRISSGDEALIGVLTGFSEPYNSKLYMTIHSIPEKNKTFVHVNETRVVDSTHEEDTVYAYGNLFDEMNEIVNKYTEHWDNSESDFNTTLSSEPIALNSYSSINDNDKYQGQKISYKSSSTTNYPVIAVCAAGPDSVVPNLVYYTRIKVNSNNQEARNYITASLSPGVLTGLSVSGTAEMTIEKNEIEYDDLNPESKSRNVIIPLPTFDIISKTVSITTLTFRSMIVDAINKAVGTGSYNTSRMNNCASWNFSKYNDISCTTGEDPAECESGFGAYATFSYFGSSVLDADAIFNAELTYTYTTQFGVTQYAGSFGTSASLPYEINFTN